MALRDYRKFFFNDPSLMSIQDSIEEFARQITDSPLLSGVLLEDILLTSSGDNVTYHGLQRPYRGFLVTLSNADATIYESDTLNTVKREKIILKCSADVTASLWVF